MINRAQPAVSVIVPTYNRKELLRRAVESVLHQTCIDFELIVIDDGSTDETESVLQQYSDPRIRYVKQSNSGVARARNRGIDEAGAGTLLFLDSDDELYPEALERGLAYIAPGYDMVFAPFRLESGGYTGFSYEEDREISFLDLLCERGMQTTKTGFVMMRRSAVAEHRFAARNLDFIFYRDVAARARLFFVAEPLGMYHEHTAGSMTKNRKKSDAALSIDRSRALEGFLERHGSLLLQHCPAKYADYAYGAAVGLLLQNETTKARVYAYDAARMQPRARYWSFYALTLIPFSPAILRTLFSLKGALQKIR